MNKLLKKLLATISFILIVFGSIAAPVDTTEAKRLAINFIENNLGNDIDPDNLQQIHFQNQRSQGQPAFYIYNFDHGFVIISGNDATIPVLGYSTEQRFEGRNIPDGLQALLEQYQSEIESITENTSSDSTIERQWQNLRNRTGNTRQNRSVNHFIESSWGQDPLYNQLCPTDPNASSGHAVAGCIAVAMAQVMRYWQYPTNGFGSNGYTSGNYGYQFADFSNSSYLYSLMPNEINAQSPENQKNAVATLIYHCGVAVNMSYGTTASSAYALGNAPSCVYAMAHYFGYGDAIGIRRNAFPTDAAWIDTLERQLNHGYPIILTGSGSTGSHTFVCDGYNNSDQFHINWGWKGLYNGYFTITSLTPGTYDYSSNQNAIINLHPTPTANIVVTPNALTFSPLHTIDSVQVEGVLLHQNISVSGGFPFVVSLDKSNWTTNCTLDSTGGKFYVQYFATNNEIDSTNLLISSNNVPSKFVKVKGYGILDTIFASAVGGAVIEPEGTILVPRHQSQSFHISAIDDQHVFNFLTVDDDIISEETDSYTFNDIIGTHSITAVYRQLVPHIVYEADTLHCEAKINQTSWQVTHLQRVDFTEPIVADVWMPYSISLDNENWSYQIVLRDEFNTVYLRYQPESANNLNGILLIRTAVTAIRDSVPILGKLSPYNIYLYSNNGGQYEADTNTIKAAYDTSITVRFTAYSTHRIAQVIVDDEDFGPLDSVVLSNIQEDHFIYVLYQDRSVDVQNFDIEDISIYPNPASDYLKISLGDQIQNVELQIFDLNGKMLKRETIAGETVIDLQGFAEGTYFFVFQSEGWSGIKKVVRN